MANVWHFARELLQKNMEDHGRFEVQKDLVYTSYKQQDSINNHATLQTHLKSIHIPVTRTSFHKLALAVTNYDLLGVYFENKQN